MATITLKDEVTGKEVQMPVLEPTYGAPVVDIGKLAKEFGYFTLRELESVRGPLGLPIERDLHFKPRPLKEVMAYHGESV